MTEENHLLITPLLRLAIQIYRLTIGSPPSVFGDLYLVPNCRTTGVAQFQTIKITWKNLPFLLIGTANLLLPFVGCGYMLLKKFIYRDKMNLDTINLIIFIAFFISALVILTSFRDFCILRDEIPFVNNLLSNALRFQLLPKNDDYVDYSGYALCYLIIGIVVFPLPGSVVATFYNLNPFQHIINETVLPHPYFHTLTMVVLRNVVSWLLLSSVLWLLFVRILFLAIAGPILASVTLDAQIQSLIKGRLSERQILRNYIRLWLLLAEIQLLLNRIIFLLISWSQVFILLLVWASIRCFDILPKFMLVGAFAAMIGGIGLATLLLISSSNIRLNSLRLVNSKRCKYHGYNRHRSNYYYTLKWRAQQAIPLSCGTHFKMSMDAVMIYLKVLTENALNAILLIIPDKYVL
ncbi:unnamed protein product [Orchesella dallaii]|uniref:Uncharacterized protein n=1 Tax=Orchesella dallaii TaxID=48710 RepID=A0ABP1PLS1_9HEXA